MESFAFYNPTKIHFGAGGLNEIGSILKKYGSKCMLITTSNKEEALRPLYDRVKSILSENGIEVFHYDEAVPNPTVRSIEKGIGIVKKRGIDVIAAVGGGSSIDTAKAISLFHQADQIDWDNVYREWTDPFAEYESPSNPLIPVIAVPTTSGTGSELTQAMVISDQSTSEKVCIFHDKVFPLEAIIDSDLTVTLPPKMTALTGFDAFSHAFESYVRNEANSYTKMLSIQAIKLIIEALPALMHDLNNPDLREKMSLAEMFAGISLANAAATIPHPLSEIIGGVNSSIPHGQCLASLYPGFLRFQIKKTPGKCADIARILNSELKNNPDEEAAAELPRLVEDFLDRLGIAASLSELGVTEEEQAKMSSHFLLTVLPFASKDELINIMRASF